MGRAINHADTLTVLCQLNYRFGAGDAIREMVSLQREFKIFSPDHSLSDAFLLLGIGPRDRYQNTRWKRFLGTLKRYKSDAKGVDGHDRIVTALQENLEGKRPLPVFFKVHADAQKGEILVSVGRSVIFIPEDHLTISIPVAANPEPAIVRPSTGKR